MGDIRYGSDAGFLCASGYCATFSQVNLPLADELAEGSGGRIDPNVDNGTTNAGIDPH